MLINRNGARGFHISDDANRKVDVSSVAAENISTLIRPKRKAISSVEGYLRAISIHRGMKFIVYHARTNKAVTCYFQDPSYMEVIKTVLGNRVAVIGTVHYNAKNEPVKVEMEKLRIFKAESELPTTQELSGSDPGFTGGLSVEEYMRRLRA